MDRGRALLFYGQTLDRNHSNLPYYSKAEFANLLPFEGAGGLRIVLFSGVQSYYYKGLETNLQAIVQAG